MKLVNARYGLSIEFEENKVNCLVIENPSVMGEIIGELYSQTQGEEGNFILVEGTKELKPSKCLDFVLEPFSLSVNSKKYQTQLYAELCNYVNEARYEQKCEIEHKLVELIDDIGMASAYNIEFDLDISMDTLLKAARVRFCEEYLSLKEKVVQYISIVSSLNIISLMVFVNLKSYFVEEELVEIYKAANYCKMPMLLIEGEERVHMEKERCCIIDKDLCIIEA